MSQNRSRGSLWVTVGLAGLSAGYFFVFFLPGWKTIRATRDDVRSRRDYVMQTAGTQAALLATQQEREKTEGYNAMQAAAMPHPGTISQLFAQITTVSKAAGTTTLRFTPEPLVKHAQISHFTLALSVAGSTAQIYDFVRQIEGLPSRPWIEVLRIGNSKKGSEETTADITLVIFADNSTDSDYVKPTDKPINQESQASAAAPRVGALP